MKKAVKKKKVVAKKKAPASKPKKYLAGNLTNHKEVNPNNYPAFLLKMHGLADELLEMARKNNFILSVAAIPQGEIPGPGVLTFYGPMPELEQLLGKVRNELRAKSSGIPAPLQELFDFIKAKANGAADCDDPSCEEHGAKGKIFSSTPKH